MLMLGRRNSLRESRRHHFHLRVSDSGIDKARKSSSNFSHSRFTLEEMRRKVTTDGKQSSNLYENSLKEVKFLLSSISRESMTEKRNCLFLN